MFRSVQKPDSWMIEVTLSYYTTRLLPHSGLSQSMGNPYDPTNIFRDGFWTSSDSSRFDSVPELQCLIYFLCQDWVHGDWHGWTSHPASHYFGFSFSTALCRWRDSEGWQDRGLRLSDRVVWCGVKDCMAQDDGSKPSTTCTYMYYMYYTHLQTICIYLGGWTSISTKYFAICCDLGDSNFFHLGGPIVGQVGTDAAKSGGNPRLARYEVCVGACEMPSGTSGGSSGSTGSTGSGSSGCLDEWEPFHMCHGGISMNFCICLCPCLCVYVYVYVYVCVCVCVCVWMYVYMYNDRHAESVDVSWETEDLYIHVFTVLVFGVSTEV